MLNPFDALPSYVKDSPKFSKFLELLNSYLISGAVQVSLYKNAFITPNKRRFVIESLARGLGASVNVPFVNGEPDWDTYYKQLWVAYRAKSFVVASLGRRIDFILGDSLSDISTISVLDFSVSKNSKTPMSVVYSVLSMDENLTYATVRDMLIPNITGVGTGIYFLQYGQDVFGYDRDDKYWDSETGEYKSVHIVYGPSGAVVEPTNENKFVVASASIEAVGSGYQVGETVTANGISFVIVDLAAGAFLGIANTSATFATDPTARAVAVTGGSGTGMTVNISGVVSTGYSVRGWDDAPFFPIARG